MKKQPDNKHDNKHDKDLKEAPEDIAERPGSTNVNHDHADELVDKWGEESFPASDPPAHY